MSKDLKHEQNAGEVKAKMSYLANNYVNAYKPSNTLCKHKIFKKLRNNKDILITKPDKGNGVIIVNRAIYMSSLSEIINGTSKFLKLPSDPTIGREGKLQRFLSTLNKKSFFSKKQYENIYLSGSQPARLYGNHKTHKLMSESNKLTFHPIVSSIGAYNYKLAKFLTSMLDLVILKDHCTKDSFSFCKEIKKVSSTNKLISYDTCSLFTSISLNRTIDLAVKLIFDNNPTIKITKKDLKKHFEFATSKTHILFDGNYYDQIDGIAMGSPLGLVLAKSFYGFLRKAMVKGV